ncbi:hypothetical protein NS220_16350 [Microbacterium testaceum]|uniref:Lipoprotein n=1 Tax=Microbacterium testaceum TaxID=2033 RepID=A0A147ETB9_MICTE|nr:hypothetical protein [Microbacterium testaceum]KTR88413.1 hypothetical protein NS220_16350 [Microbacterium testaceum]
MSRTRRRIAATLTTASALVLTGCSLDGLIWGREGAHVIDTTRELIDAAAAGDAEGLVCSGRDQDLGSPSAWDGLSAEEPEEFVADYWPTQAEHDPTWSINLSLPAGRVASGVEYPGDLFYREDDGGLCLVDIAWSTVQ